jgi:DivIVA domain-containing protein
MTDMLTPEEVEATTFPESENGYEKAHVDAFLRTIAEEIRQLKRDIATAEQKAEKPYRGVAREMADLMEHASDIARQLATNAEEKASSLLHEAQESASKMKKEATELRSKAKLESETMLAEAKTEAVRKREQAAHLRRLAEAEGSVLRQEIQREAKRLRAEARRKIEEARTQAERDSVERAQALETRVRKLVEAETTLKKRVAALTSRVHELEEQAPPEEPAPAAPTESPTVEPWLLEPPEEQVLRLDSEKSESPDVRILPDSS